MGLLDRFTATVSAVREAFARAPKKSVVVSVATPSPYQDRDADMLGNALTPKRLTTILWARNQGELAQWHDLADEMREKNPHLHSQLAIRELSVVETQFAIVEGRGSNRRAARRAAHACRDLLDSWVRREDADAGEDHNNLWRWLAEFVESHYYACGAHEVMWDRSMGEVYPDHLVKIDPRRLSYACDSFDPDPWALRIWDQYNSGPFSRQYGVKLNEFHPDKFLVHRPRVRGSQPPREGLFAVVVWWCLFYTWDWRDLMALVEMLGRPPVIGYYSAGGGAKSSDSASLRFNADRAATKQELDALSATVKQVAGSLRSVLADTTRVETVKLPTMSESPVQARVIELIDGVISKAINGVANLSDLRPGARAAVEVQERTSLTFWRSDCRYAAARLSWLMARYIRANPDRFGVECPLPTVEAQIDDTDYLAMIDRVSRSRAAGLRIPRAWAYEVTGTPEPQDGDAVLGETTNEKPTT